MGLGGCGGGSMIMIPSARAIVGTITNARAARRKRRMFMYLLLNVLFLSGIDRGMSVLFPGPADFDYRAG